MLGPLAFPRGFLDPIQVVGSLYACKGSYTGEQSLYMGAGVPM